MFYYSTSSTLRGESPYTFTSQSQISSFPTSLHLLSLRSKDSRLALLLPSSLFIFLCLACWGGKKIFVFSLVQFLATKSPAEIDIEATVLFRDFWSMNSGWSAPASDRAVRARDRAEHAEIEPKRARHSLGLLMAG